MTKKRKLKNLGERCRLCLADGGSMSALFVESLENEIQDLSVSTSVDIEKESHLPKNVCHVCLYKLNMWAEFKERFVRTNKLLLSNFEVAGDSEKKQKMDAEESWEFDAKEGGEEEDEEEEEEDESMMQMSQENGRDWDMKDMASPARRGSIKPSMEKRRKMMTKRWGERKRALVAATGELVSESDSVASDNVELSPVQKARAKTNADKELEQRKKRVDRALKKLEIDANFPVDRKGIRSVSDSARKSLLNANAKSPPQNHSKEPKENYVPRSVKSEFEIGDATFIVTSTLFFAESQATGSLAASSESGSLEKKDALKKEIQEDGKGTDEKNSGDIFAAVQLRRVNPKSPPTRGKNFIERCLNIEVEGRELEALERLQFELAAFVEKEMKGKLSNDSSVVNSKESSSQEQTLEQRLKAIVEKAIRANYKTQAGGKEEGEPALSLAFVEAAQRSAIFQPKVLVDRLSPEALGKLDGPRSRRRTAQQPARYRDYDVSGMGSDDEGKPKSAADVPSAWPRLAAASAYKVVYDSLNQPPTNQQYSPIISKQPLTTPKQQHPKQEVKLCGVCGKAFLNLKDITEHIKTHNQQLGVACAPRARPYAPTGVPDVAKPREASQSDKRLMRCKRCHDIVEARFVKMHVCNNRQSFKCNVCKMLFRSDKQLISHLQTAHIRPKKIIPEARESQQGPSNISEKIALSSTTTVKPEPKQMLACCFCDKTFTDSSVLNEHVQQHCDEASNENVSKDNFCCGICGNSMESEEALEKHVKWHLFDDGDDNPNLINVLGHDKMDDTEESKEEKEKPAVFKCPECPQEFASEALLVMHQPLHAEEAKIALWMQHEDAAGSITFGCSLCQSSFKKESQLNLHMLEHSKTSTVCVLCESLFETLEQLQEHVKTH